MPENGWHEMGIYDMPATIDYILKTTNNDQLHVVGHSMGATMFYVMTSMRPKYNGKIRTMVSLSPVARMTKYYQITYNSSLIYFLLNDVLDHVENQGKVEMFPRGKFKGRSPHQIECGDFFITVAAFCCTAIKLAQGLTKGPVVPGGTSVKTSRHYFQNIGTGKFQKYDYRDDDLNMAKWGNTTPPEYDLKKVTSPIAVFYSPSDELISAEDAEYMVSTLPNVIHVWKSPNIGFSHLDFAISTNPLSAGPRMKMINELVKLLNGRNTLR